MLGRAVNNRKTDGESNSAGKASVERGREKTTSIGVHGREISERRGALDAGDPASNEERGDWLEAAGFVLRVEVGLLVESEVDAKRCAVLAVGKKGRGGAGEFGPAVLEDVLRASDDGGIRLGEKREGGVGLGYNLILVMSAATTTPTFRVYKSSGISCVLGGSASLSDLLSLSSSSSTKKRLLGGRSSGSS